MPDIRALIADPLPLFRHALLGLLKEEPTIEKCLEAGSVKEALELFERERPQLAIVDITLPDGGARLIETLNQREASLKILALSAGDDLPYADQAFAKGALGYISKRAEPVEFSHSIKCVLNGDRYASAVVARHWLTRHTGVSKRATVGA